jgi:hypothetical protein
MAYHFGSAVTDNIDMGTAVAKHTTAFSVYARFALAQVNGNNRMIACYHDGVSQAIFYLFATNSLGNNSVAFGISTGGGTTFPGAHWLSGFGVGEIHTCVGTYDGANIKLYADTDATAKVIQPETGTADSVAGQHFMIGNQPSASISADGNIYEIGWWPGTVLTGAQAAQLGAGSAAGIPLPTEYWPLIDSPNALYGGHNGTVTGAFVVTHVGKNLYPRSGSLTLLGAG